MKIRFGQIITIIISAIAIAVLIVADSICSFYAQSITNLLCGTGLKFEGEEVDTALALGDELVRDIGDESIVMLKNENNTLPLKTDERAVNLFGWASTDNGFLLTGGGSGAASIQWQKKVTLRAGLEQNGFKVNSELLDKYSAFCNARDDKQADVDPVTLIEPNKDFYTDEVIAQAKEFSDIAIVTIARWGSENMEIPYDQHKYKYSDDETRTYLQLSTEEEDMLEIVKANFSKVIVLIDTCNAMELGFLDDEGIDAALFVGMLGQSGTDSIGHILTGEESPSGRMVDTYAYDFSTNPSFADKRRNGNHIHYTEGIYIGYKWYETAWHDGYYEKQGLDYEDVVQYPFGYGLSYSNFEWNVDSISSENAEITNKYTQIEVKLTVTNNGPEEAREVVQLYASAPYTPGGIEKPYISLVAFDKTEKLEVGQSQQLTLTFDLYDIASYDCYNKNGNSVTAYELDAGEYKLMLMNDSHNLNPCDKAETKFTLPNTITYKLDPDTKQIVKNRFTGETAYAGVPIDGSTAGEPVKYLSRADFDGTFPKTATPNRSDSLIKSAQTYVYDGYDNVEKPTVGADNGLRIWTREDGSDATLEDLNGTSNVSLKLNTELVKKLGANYNDPQWNDLLDQITADELFNLVECSGYGNDAMVSIGKANNRDYDGPSGLQWNVGHVGDTGAWTGYPSQMNVGCTFSKKLAFEMGRAVGNEATVTGISGWYAPGVNLHRSPYNGRYFEYYSEDGVLSGYLAAYVIRGAKSVNVYCYLKHFALSEMGKNPRDLNVWLTEQTLRETYLRPFEIAVKEGEANGMMTAFNRVGATWAGGSKPLLTDILRTEWGFRGVVVTDWSTGDGYMNPTQGVRAGNDTWLNPNNVNGAPLSRNSDTDLYLARQAAKNMLYTIFDTYCYYDDYDPADGEFTASVGIRSVDKVFPWWIPVLVGMNVIVAGVVIWRVLAAFLPKRKKEKPSVTE